jgi:hypothetical protein
MARGPQRFRQRDLTRVIRAVKAAGVPIARVLVDNVGRIEVVVGDTAHNDPVQREPNEWDGV